MGNSGNILIQRSGINYIWFNYFVSSHNYYYLSDFSNNFLVINSFLLNFFRKKFLLFYKNGFIFSHLKIFEKNRVFIVNVFFFDLFFRKLRKYFLFKFGLKQLNKALRYKYKARLIRYNNFFYIRRFKILRLYKNFFSKYSRFNDRQNIVNLSPLFGFVRVPVLFNLFKSFFKKPNFFDFFVCNFKRFKSLRRFIFLSFTFLYNKRFLKIFKTNLKKFKYKDKKIFFKRYLKFFKFINYKRKKKKNCNF